MKYILISVLALIFMSACHENEVIHVPKRCYKCDFTIWRVSRGIDGTLYGSVMEHSARLYFRVDGNEELNAFKARYTETYQADTVWGEKTVVCIKYDSILYWDK